MSPYIFLAIISAKLLAFHQIVFLDSFDGDISNKISNACKYVSADKNALYTLKLPERYIQIQSDIYPCQRVVTKRLYIVRSPHGCSPNCIFSRINRFEHINVERSVDCRQLFYNYYNIIYYNIIL